MSTARGTDRQRQQRLVVIFARALVAAGNTDRVTVSALGSACRTYPDLVEISDHCIGQSMNAAGWRPKQWRTPAGRVRGYGVPVTGDGGESTD